MNTFLEARYNEAHRRYLDQVAYMQESNLAFAEKKGGVGALTGADKNRFEGIQSRLIDLVAFADAAGDHIADLQEWIEDLITTQRQLSAELNHRRSIEQYELIRARMTDEAKDEKRRLSIQRLHDEMPQLFARAQWHRGSMILTDYSEISGITFSL